MLETQKENPDVLEVSEDEEFAREISPRIPRVRLRRRQDIYKASFDLDASTHGDNPDLSLDPYQSVRSYFRGHEKKYMCLVHRLAEELGPMPPTVNTVICIPVAGHQEPSLWNAMENYKTQTADPKTFEIVAFLNHPNKNKQGADIPIDIQQVADLECVDFNCPELPLHYFYAILPSEDMGIGLVRKILTDVVLYRHFRRGPGAGDLIMISNDADNKGISSSYIETFQKTFQQHPNVDAFAGRLDFDTESFLRNPLLHVATRCWQYCEMYLERKAAIPVGLPGANAAYRASVYAGVGGYNVWANLGEDANLARRINRFRSGAQEHIGVARAGPGTRLFSSSRRGEEAVQRGFTPLEQWDKVAFSVEDNEVRNGDRRNHYHRPNWILPESRRQFLADVERVLIRTLNLYIQWDPEFFSDPDHFTEMLRFILGRCFQLGFHYEKRETGRYVVRITDITQLITRLITYENRARSSLEQKTGFFSEQLIQSPTPLREYIQRKVMRLMQSGNTTAALDIRKTFRRLCRECKKSSKMFEDDKTGRPRSKKQIDRAFLFYLELNERILKLVDVPDRGAYDLTQDMQGILFLSDKNIIHKRAKI